jgi:hypothetical protein
MSLNISPVHHLIACKTGKRWEKAREVKSKKGIYITNEETSC